MKMLPKLSPALFSRNLPGFRTIGVIQRELGDIGVLVKHETTGIYAQANCGGIRTIDQKAANAALDVATK